MSMRKYRAWVRNADYIVSDCNVFEVIVDDYGGEATLKPVDEIPDEYREKWSDEQ